jgi:hypothetical protein
VAACHGPGNTIIILTAARVLFLVAHNGDKHQLSRSSSAGVEPLAGSADSKFTQQQLQFQQQQVLEKFSVKVRCPQCAPKFGQQQPYKQLPESVCMQTWPSFVLAHAVIAPYGSPAALLVCLCVFC